MRWVMTKSTVVAAALAMAALSFSARDASARHVKKFGKPNPGQMQKACDKGALKVCVKLAWYTMDGWYGTTQDVDKSAALMKKACDGGEASGCSGLARAQSYNSNELKPEQTALFKQGCDAGDADGCYWLGRWAAVGADRNDAMKKAYGLYVAACDGGDAEACYSAGVMNRDSHQDSYDDAVPWSDEASNKLWADACNASYPEACSRLGGNYEEAKGVAENWKKAKQLYDKACKLGDSDGCQWSQDLVQKALLAGVRL